MTLHKPIGSGEKFGRLTVRHRVPQGNRSRGVYYEVSCECGNVYKAESRALRTGKVLSCGCLIRERFFGSRRTHGCSNPKTPTYLAWHSMKQRCLNPKSTCYQNYGGRGIKVCERWMIFENFLADMGESPRGLTLERNDVNGNYEPSNCRWATNKEQAFNKRNTVFLEHEGKRMLLREWAAALGVPPARIYKRLWAGMSVAKALTPVRLSRWGEKKRGRFEEKLPR